MHDLDRTQLEMEQDEYDTNEFNEFEGGEFEASDEYENDFESDSESPFNEADEMDLAAELLSVSDENELDQFLGKLIKKAGRAIGKAVRSPLGKKLGGLLRAAAKKALPVIGGAAGTFFGGPAGSAFGSNVGAKAGQLFGLELEGLSAEDQEFESARQFVRFAGSAVQNAHENEDEAEGMESEVAHSAIKVAAQRHAPGLLQSTPRVRDHRASRVHDHRTPAAHASRAPRADSGRWVRKNGRIVLLGV